MENEAGLWIIDKKQEKRITTIAIWGVKNVIKGIWTTLACYSCTEKTKPSSNMQGVRGPGQNKSLLSPSLPPSLQSLPLAEPNGKLLATQKRVLWHFHPTSQSKVWKGKCGQQNNSPLKLCTSYVTSHGKRDLADGIGLRILRWGVTLKSLGDPVSSQGTSKRKVRIRDVVCLKAGKDKTILPRSLQK